MGLSTFYKFVEQVSLRETDPINQARVKILAYSLTCNLIFVTVSVVVYFFQGPPLQLVRSLVALFFAIFMLYAVTRWNVWKQISQLVSVLVTLVVWSNLLVYVQGVNIPTLQFAFLIIVYSFYVHGLRWGDPILFS